MTRPALTTQDRHTLEAVWDAANRKLDRRLRAKSSTDEGVAVARPGRSLTSEQVEQVRLRQEGGETISQLAREFQVTADTISQVIVRRW